MAPLCVWFANRFNGGGGMSYRSFKRLGKYVRVVVSRGMFGGMYVSHSSGLKMLCLSVFVSVIIAKGSRKQNNIYYSR